MGRALAFLALAALAAAAIAAAVVRPWEEPAPGPAQAVIAGDVAGAITFELLPQNGSGEFGFVTLEPAEEAGTQVLLDLAGVPGPPQPAHVHEGVCGGAAPRPLHDLGLVLHGGTGETATGSALLDASVDELRTGHRVVDVHRSELDPTVVACVQIGDAGP